jgi:predicted transcriptional regulator
MLIVNFFTTFLWITAFLILYRKYKELKDEKFELEIKLSRKSMDELFASSIKSSMQIHLRQEIDHFKKEAQEYKEKYLNVLEQNLRLAEKIGSDTE